MSNVFRSSIAPKNSPCSLESPDDESSDDESPVSEDEAVGEGDEFEAEDGGDDVVKFDEGG